MSHHLKGLLKGGGYCHRKEVRLHSVSDINVLLKIIHHTVVLKKTSLVLGAEWRPSPTPHRSTSGELEALLLCKTCFPSPPSSSGFVVSEHLGG